MNEDQKKPWLAVGVTGVLAIATAITGFYEGSSTKAYLDPVGIPTICAGHILGVKIGDTATPEQCTAMLKSELQQRVVFVQAHNIHAEPDTRVAAEASFAYNIGNANYMRSSFLRYLNAPNPRSVTKACGAMMLWVYAGGRKLQGLANRRAAERDLCLQGLTP